MTNPLLTPSLIPCLIAMPGIVPVIEALQVPGREARFVGGCVRDALCGNPIKDIDIATPLSPSEVIELFEQKAMKVKPTGIEHGTVMVIAEHNGFEITTLRKDINCDGRHAIVEFTDNWEEDAARRDFTFNAMSCSLKGELYDYFGGYEDLKQGRVRFVGDPEMRIQEDVLRILRFFRFGAYFGKQPMDNAMLEACRKWAHLLPRLSAERIQMEMLKLLSAPNPVYVLMAMEKTGVLSEVAPEITDTERLAQLIACEQRLRIAPDPIRRLAFLLQQKDSEALSHRFRLSNHHKHQLMELQSGAFTTLKSMPIEEVKRQIRRLGKAIVKDKLLLAYASGGSTDRLTMIDLIEQWEIPTFPLAGKDLLLLGIKPGKPLGELLKMLEDWWEEKDYQPTKEQLLREAKKHML